MSRFCVPIASALLLLSSGLVLPAGAAEPEKKQVPATVAPKAPAVVARPAPVAPHIAAPIAAPPPHIAAPARSFAPPHISVSRNASYAAPHIQRNVVQRNVVQRNVVSHNAVSSRVTAREIRLQQRQARTQERIQERAQARTQQARVSDRVQTKAQDRQQIRDLRLKQREELRQARTPAQRRQLLAQQREQLQTLRSQQQLGTQKTQNQNSQAKTLSGNGAAAATTQAAQQGRFAARFQNDPNRAQRTAFAAAPEAWRHRLRAAFVPWFGSVFYPYAYWDVFAYTFWPDGYDPGYWAYAYDDFFDSVYFPYDTVYADYAGPAVVETTGSAPDRGPASRRYRTASAPLPGHVSPEAQQLCREPDKSITAWPIERIEQTVQPNQEQRRLLADLKDAAARAAETFKELCLNTAALTPPGRLQAMVSRLQATLDAVRLVRSPLEKFYNSLSDEQKARFNALGPNLGQNQTAQSGPQNQQASNCREGKPGLTNLPMQRIEEIVRPVGAQKDAFGKLSDATEKSVETLQAACPDVAALTPVGRLAQMDKRLDAMLQAAKTLQPPLEDFYASLSNEQKARFNALGREAERGG